ncbi:MAG: hypothetical protein ACJ8NS_11330 [Chthoniobacterales bacterium]
MGNNRAVSEGRYSRRPSVSCVLLTDGLTRESAEWFSTVRDIVDELVIFVDTELANPETHAFAHELGSIVHEVRGRGFVEAHLKDMVLACSSDWILRLDSDEKLTHGWMDGGWRDFLVEEYTHFTTPRRWIHPDGGYIRCEPWWPDPQMRLFRNDIARLTFPQKIHEPTQVTGLGKNLPSLAIDHHVLRLTTRAQREEKARRYTKLRPELPLGHYYLFEDFDLLPHPLTDTGFEDSGLEIASTESAS